MLTTFIYECKINFIFYLIFKYSIARKYIKYFGKTISTVTISTNNY